MAMTRMI